MSKTFSTVGLIGKYADPSVRETLLQVSHVLEESGVEVLLDEHTAEVLDRHSLTTATRHEIGSRCDLAITVGGDGTLLNAARSLVNYGVPLLGINLGRLGFLVDIPPHGIEKHLKQILKGHYQEEHRILLSAQVCHEGELLSESEAFNDVALHKWEVARMVETETYIDGKLLNSMRSDGLIVSTPTGSTAYALSAGGPILQPSLDAMVLVPICPHTMSYRPIVIDGNSKIEIMVTDRPHTHAQITCDGQINLGVVSGDKVIIKRHEKRACLIHPLDHDFSEILRAKLHWGEHF
ncbi:MAG: NAD(+) kinase [Gammaproteobacteria bacterium]